MSYKIPQNRVFNVSNGSDLTPNIQYVKNCNFDELGYIKLSAPMLNHFDDNVDTDFDVPVDIVQYPNSNVYFKLLTNSKVYNIYYDGAEKDSGATGISSEDNSRFVTFEGPYIYANIGNSIYQLSDNGTTWTEANTDSVGYPILFVNRNTYVGSTGSNILQYTEADFNPGTPTGSNSGVTLTLPSAFEVTGMAYSNHRVGISTRHIKKGEAFFFIWDGATTSASSGFGVKANMIMDVVAYKNSWAILTSLGQLLYFNGGGFDLLGNLPPYYFDTNWYTYGSSFIHGKIMEVVGDIINFNIGSLLNSSDDDSGILKGFYSGIWCYDPEVKFIYHKHALSHSKIINDIGDAVAGVFTYTAHGLETGDLVRYDNSNTFYYAIKLTADTYSLADTYDLAIAGTPTADSVNYTKSFVQRTDWGQLTALNTNFGLVKTFEDASLQYAYGLQPMFAGLGILDKDFTYTNTLCIKAPTFANIGSIVYSKIVSESVTDIWQKLYLKFRPLTKGSKIIVKIKTNEYPSQIAIGEADDINSEIYITWTNSTTFTTTKDLSLVSAGDEVEFMSGVGAGSTAHITSLTDNAGTWTVVMDEVIRGAGSGKKSTCVFDKFIKLKEITSSNSDGLMEIPVAINSKWIQVKAELRGIDVTIEELQVVNKTFKPSE